MRPKKLRSRFADSRIFYKWSGVTRFYPNIVQTLPYSVYVQISVHGQIYSVSPIETGRRTCTPSTPPPLAPHPPSPSYFKKIIVVIPKIKFFFKFFSKFVLKIRRLPNPHPQTTLRIFSLITSLDVIYPVRSLTVVRYFKRNNKICYSSFESFTMKLLFSKWGTTLKKQTSL